MNQQKAQSSINKTNSKSKFVDDISNSGFLTVDLTTQTFKTPQPQCVQKMHSLSLTNQRKRPAAASASDQNAKSTKTQPPNPKPIASKQSSSAIVAPKSDPLREMALTTGNVEFVIKMNKLYPNFNYLYEVYARILKISKGKSACEHTILLRNDTGPVLQGVYFEIDTPMPVISSGMNVCCVGRFIGSSRFHLFKIKPINSKVKEETLSRFKNLCTFTANKRNINK